MIAIPTFGSKSHIAIARLFGFIRATATTSSTYVEGEMLRQPVTTDNISSEVWADSAYRSKANEAWLANHMVKSQIHRRKPANPADVP